MVQLVLEGEVSWIRRGRRISASLLLCDKTVRRRQNAPAAGHRRPATADKTARLFYDRTGRLWQWISLQKYIEHTGCRPGQREVQAAEKLVVKHGGALGCEQRHILNDFLSVDSGQPLSGWFSLKSILPKRGSLSIPMEWFSVEAMSGNHCNYYSFGVLLMAVSLESRGNRMKKAFFLGSLLVIGIFSALAVRAPWTANR